MNRRTIAILITVAAVGITSVACVRVWRWRRGEISIQGAVIRSDQDTRKQLPIAGAVVTASDGVITATTQSDAAGYYNLKFREHVWPGETLNLHFEHNDYRPLDLRVQMSLRPNKGGLYVAALKPIVQPPDSAERIAVISNIRVRYTINLQSETNIGTAAKTFQVTNRGNVPCQHQYPCSPDGVWKASIGSTTMDAGPDSEFRNVRTSCFAGPCPFTRIDSSGYTHGGRVITASALDWSDTATFLLEAEVFRDSMGSSVRESFPVIYGRVLYFTLPANQEGASIEAEIDGAQMVFPLGQELYLSWATCNSRTNESSATFECELKPGYRF